MKLVAGLGNPGLKYRSTRHNIGFMVLDSLAARFGIRARKRAFNSLCGKGKIGGVEMMLAKPLTYMNLSGIALSAIKHKEGVALEDLLVIMDDVDLPLGKIRLRPKGSSGSHKGLRSVVEKLESESFPRLRVGIAPQEEVGYLKDYVLSPFKRNERKTLASSIERCTRCVETWARDGIESAMRIFNA